MSSIPESTKPGRKSNGKGADKKKGKGPSKTIAAGGDGDGSPQLVAALAVPALVQLNLTQFNPYNTGNFCVLGGGPYNLPPLTIL
jgi:hypothetical protein